MLAYIVFCEACPNICALRIHGHGYGRFSAALVVIGNARVGNDTSVERGFPVTARSLYCNEFVDVVGSCKFAWLYRPHRTEFRREKFRYLRNCEKSVDFCSVN